MFDLYADEGARTLDNAAARPSLQPEPGFFSGGGDLAMQGFAKTARAVDLIGSVGLIVMDKLTGGTGYQDEYFKEHDEVFNRAVDYWTPAPGTVGKAGQVIGGLVPVIGQVLISPALAIGTAGLGTGEDLVRQGVDSSKAVPAAIAQAAGMGVGVYMPIFGSTWATRALVAGAGANVVQGIATKALTKQILKGDKAADQYDPWDLEGIVLDTLMGVAFGSLARLGAKAQDARDAMTQSDRDALLVAQQARHMEDTTSPGRPDDPMSATAHVDAVKKAADDLLAGRPVNVDQIVQDARFSDVPDRNAEAIQLHDEMVRQAEAMVTAYHGSPHDFEKFDLSKIGTGEGAQSFGHGLYFAESPGVAGSYQKALAPPGKLFVDDDLRPGARMQLHDFGPGTDAYLLAYNALSYSKGDAAAARQELARNTWSAKETVADALRQIEKWDARTISYEGERGHLYRVEIPQATVDRMLDWDKPLSEQPESVRGPVAKLIDNIADADTKEWIASEGGVNRLTGAQAHDVISKTEVMPADDTAQVYQGQGSRNEQGAASKLLRESGIPGIRYLDGGSRTAGEGTRNFVLFDAEHARIVEKNGEKVIRTDDPRAPIEPLVRDLPSVEHAVRQAADEAGVKVEPPDPLLTEARQRAALHGDIEVPTGAIDENGNAVTRKLGEMYDEAAQRTAQAKADVNLFTVAASCMMGGL